MNRFVESNESNNWRTETFNVQSVSAADVIVEDVWLSNNSPRAGEQVSVFARVKNQGTVTTGDSVGVGFWINGEHLNGYWHVANPMGPGAVKTFKMDVDYRTENSGKITVTAWVDDINRFPESNETNNKRTESYDIVS
ncbi:MAG: hypothetical protein CUN57_02370, partial [Phototrophicales bacterium]